MLLWRVGATLWLFRWIFRDPRVDVRLLVLGAALPDLIDLPIGTLIFADTFSRGELWAHSLIIPSLYMSAVLLTTRRGRRRRALMAVGIGWLLHLLIDGMWLDQDVFLWPFFGWEMTPGPAPFWPLAWERALSDPWRWVTEAIGAGYLVWLWRAHGLSSPERLRQMLSTGRLT
jgi:hypothetical protein